MKFIYGVFMFFLKLRYNFCIGCGSLIFWVDWDISGVEDDFLFEYRICIFYSEGYIKEKCVDYV